jgi:hypothetical protein
MIQRLDDVSDKAVLAATVSAASASIAALAVALFA